MVGAERRACAAAAAVWGAALLPMFLRLSHDQATGFLANDWLPHLDVAHELRWRPLHIGAPHFGLHVGTRLFDTVLPGTGLRTSMALLCAGASALTGLLVTRFLLRPLPGSPTVLSPQVALAGSLWLLFSEMPQVLVFGADALRFDRLNASLHQWGTPTNILAEPVQLVWLILVVRTFTVPRPTRTERAVVVGLGVVTALVLPALTLAMPVGLALWLWRRGDLRERASDLVRLIWVPLGVVAVAQTAIANTWMATDRQGGLDLVALGGLRHVNLWGPGLGVFVLAGLWLLAGRGSLRANPELALLGWCLVVALIALLSIAETGGRSSEGNIGRVAYSVASLAYLYLTRWLFGVAADWRAFRSWPIRLQVTAPLLAVYALVCLVGGVALHLEQIGLIRFTGTEV